MPADWNRLGILWFLPALTMFVLFCVTIAHLRRWASRWPAKALRCHRTPPHRLGRIRGSRAERCPRPCRRHIPGASVRIIFLPGAACASELFLSPWSADANSIDCTTLRNAARRSFCSTLSRPETHSAYAYRVDFAQFSITERQSQHNRVRPALHHDLPAGLTYQSAAHFSLDGLLIFPHFLMHMFLASNDVLSFPST